MFSLIILCLFVLFSEVFGSENLNSSQELVKVKPIDSQSFEVTFTLPDSNAISSELREILNSHQNNSIKFDSSINQNLNLTGVTRYVIVPPGQRLEIEQLENNFEQLDLSKSQLNNPSADLAEYLHLDSPNDLQNFPEKSLRISSIESFRGHQVVPITYYPLSYNRESRDIQYCNKMKLSLQFADQYNSPDNANVDINRNTLTKDTYRFLDAVAVNPPQRDDNGAGLARGGYLIVVGDLERDNIEEHVELLADWKRACGHRVEVVWGEDNSNTITNDFIRPAYEEWDPPLEYVCLIGHYGNLPGPNTYKDIAYGMLVGGDHLAEVAVGRLSARNENEAIVAIGRALGYQANPNTEDMDWFDKAGAGQLRLGGWTEAVNYTVLWIIEAERRAGFDPVWWHFSNGNGGNRGGTPSRWVRNNVNIVFTRGYESPDGSFQRVVFPMYITSGGGHTEGNWERTWRSGSPDELLGPSVLTGTRHNPETIPCNVLAGGMAKGILVDRMSVGWARAFAMSRLDYAGVQGRGWDFYATEFSLFGEPSQIAWYGAPAITDVNHPETITEGQNLIEIQVNFHEDDQPVPLALVTITQPGSLFDWEITDSNGMCRIQIDPDWEDEIILTVTGDGLLPYKETIEFDNSPVCISGSIREIDDSDGNDNGVLNPGETIELFFEVHNLSSRSAAQDVTGVIQCLNPWIELENSEFEIDRINAESSVDIENPVTITLSESSTELNDLSLYVTFEAGDDSWISLLPLEVEGPDYEILEIVGGTVREPGIQNLSLRLRNIGSLESAPLIAELDSDNPWIQIIEGNTVYPEMRVNQNMLPERNFRINVIEFAVPGIIVPLELYLKTSEDGIPDTIRFELQCDTPGEGKPLGPDDYGYVCFDNNDEAWESAPEFNWIEINPEDDEREFDGEALPGNRSANFTKVIDLPFTFIYYGQEFDEITVCENGFISMGDLEGLGQYENFPLDQSMSGSFGMLAPYWDDISADGGNIYTFFDEEEEVFIIQWDNVSAANRLTFEIILYDPERYPVVSGDGNFLFQYLVAPDPRRGNSPNYFSAGISSPDGRTGLNYTADNEYPETAARITNRRAIFFTTSPVCSQGFLYGKIIDHANNQPIVNAIILTKYGQVAISDGNGDWEIPDAWALPFDISAFKQGFNDSTRGEYQLQEDERMEINFSLLHPEFIESDIRITSTIDMDTSLTVPFSIENNGNGTLDWIVNRRLIGDANCDPWELRRSIPIASQVEDNRIYGVVFDGEFFYLSGSNSQNPLIYVFNGQGEPVRSFSQPGQNGTHGMHDMAWDGEFIWGSVGNRIFGFNRDGEVTFEWETEDVVNLITWDCDRGVYWLGHTVSNLHAYDREGNLVNELLVDRNYLRLYGISYIYDDEDNCNLYALHLDRETNTQAVSKYNIETGGCQFICLLETEDNVDPGGIVITNQYDVYSWVLMSVAETSNNYGGDRLDIWQVNSRKDWFKLAIIENDERSEATEGIIEAGDDQQFEITFRSYDLIDTLFQSELFFRHNADSGYRHIMLDLDVMSQEPPSAFNLIYPSNGDTLDSLNVQFNWQPSIDPNLFDEVSYELSLFNDLHTFNVLVPDTTTILQIDTLGFENLSEAQLSWQVIAISNEDSLPCSENFTFNIPLNDIREIEYLKPFVFGINKIYPNPFNSMTSISFGLEKAGFSRLLVFDLTGRKVSTLFQANANIGNYHIAWQPEFLAAGIYFLALESKGRTNLRKVIIVK